VSWRSHDRGARGLCARPRQATRAGASGGRNTRVRRVGRRARSGASQIGILRKAVELGKGTAAEADAALGRLQTSTDAATVLAGADFVIEAAPERMDLKLSLFADIERHAPVDAVVATNTSALSITEMAGLLRKPARVAGMHFFNPVHKMKLIEIVRALESSAETLETVEAVARRMGKETVLVRERRVPSAASTRRSATRRSTC
jgi:3-hydroxybutyryl-CoA dehydrogenase